MISVKNEDLTVLIIDDNSQNLQVALNILSGAGYHLLYAQDGKKGIEITKNSKVDLILLDVLMPKMDGYTVCHQLKEDPSTREIPVIFITIKDDEKDIVKGFECGSVDYVTKPFFPSVLLKRVETHLTLAQTRNRLKDINAHLEEKVQKEIAETRHKDQILFQQSKMASMGEMIANIAHQWRQPLGAINAIAIGLKSKLLLEKFDLSQKEDQTACIQHFDEKLTNIENYTQHLTQTIDDFRNFFKPNREKTHFYISELIQTALNLVSANFKNSDIEIITHIEDARVETFENELLQVVINILNNAKDALCKTTCPPNSLIIVSTKVENGFLSIMIRDSAGGIEKDIMHKIFEPYFTTKHKSHGTGIGLYMSKEIIEKHLQGKLTVENVRYPFKDTTCEGAEFVIKIPLILDS